MRVVVVGAGLAGLCSAFSLQRAGCEVMVVDRQPGPGLETSFANGGLLTPSMSQPWNSPGVHRALFASIGRSNSPVLLRLRAIPSMGSWGMHFLRESTPSRYQRNTLKNFRLGRYSLQVLDAMAESVPADGLPRRTGALNLYRDERALSSGLEDANVLAAEGLEARMLSTHECVAVEPLLATIAGEIAGGIHFPGDRSGDAHRFCHVLAEAFQHAGGRCLYATTALDWQLRRQQVQAVVTSAGVLEADQFVVAAGSYSPRLLRKLGIRLPIYPAKGYSLTIGGMDPSSLPRVPVVDSSLHAAVATVDGRIRAAGTAEFSGFDNRISPARIANIRSLLLRIYPHLEQSSPVDSGIAWAGMRPMSFDGVPVIGPTAVANIYVNSGHGHLGWTLAAGSGELLAQLMMGRTPELDPAQYSITRFRTSCGQNR